MDKFVYGWVWWKFKTLFIKYRFLEVLYWLSEINLIETNVFFSSVFNIMVFQSESLVLRIKTVKNDIFHLIQVWTVRYQSVHSVDTVNRLTHIYAQMCPCQIPKIWKPLTWTVHDGPEQIADTEYWPSKSSVADESFIPCFLCFLGLI